MKMLYRACFILCLSLVACSPTAQVIIPTTRPSPTATATPTNTHTPDPNATPTRNPTRSRTVTPGGPTPTPLLGATRTPLPLDSTPTRPPNPNAPRIEFFTSDVLAVAPGDAVTLFWSARGVDNAAIYRLDANGARTQVWNVAPEGSLNINTRGGERGQLRFLLSIGEGAFYSESNLVIPIQCPITWFFAPPPDECPDAEAIQTPITEQIFERGRMVYVEATNTIYALFNDGNTPSWLSFENRYNPEIHPESEPDFVPPLGRYQPLRQLGFLWRANDVIRNRLGLGIQEAVTYSGFIQETTENSRTPDVFLTSSDSAILNIVPGGQIWQIISP